MNSKIYEAYAKEVAKVHSEELKSTRYTNAKEFLVNNYYNRKNLEFEKILFDIIFENDNMIYKTDKERKNIRITKYEELKIFINALSEDQILSNIFLLNAKLYLGTASRDSINILNELKNKLTTEGFDPYYFEINIPDNLKPYIPEHINETKGINYYNPRVYKTEYINVLDDKHKQIYEDYNEFIKLNDKLAESIYLFKLNDALANINDVSCEFFQIYHPGINDKLIARFAIKDNKLENTSFKDENEYMNNFNRVINEITSEKTK